MKEKLLTILEIFIVLTFFTLAAVMATEIKKDNRMTVQNRCTRCKNGYYQYQQYKDFEFYTCNECGYSISLK